MTFEEIEGKSICRLEVDSGPGPVYVDTREFWVRLQNTTQQLHGQEMLAYMKRHWRN